MYPNKFMIDNYDKKINIGQKILYVPSNPLV